MSDRDPGARDPLARLRAVRGFLFDMDGTLVLGDRRNHGLRPLPGALESVPVGGGARAAVRGVHQRDQPHARALSRGSCGRSGSACRTRR